MLWREKGKEAEKGRRKQYEKGEISILLSLLILLLLVFVLHVMESASIQVAKNMRRANMERSIESVFAEYQKQLLQEYDLFAIDGTYETGEYTEEKLEERLNVYGAVAGEQKTESIRFLSDEKELSFQIGNYMKHRLGIDQINAMKKEEQEVEEQDTKRKDWEEEQKENSRKMEDMINKKNPEGESRNEMETEQDKKKSESLLKNLLDMRKKALSEIVLPKERHISTNTVQGRNGVSDRKKREGRGAMPSLKSEGTLDKLYLISYILEHFCNYAKVEETHPLEYETEYLIGGQKEDLENLEIILKKIQHLRFIPNYLYLQTDEEKKTEARTLATVISIALASPEATEIVQQGILIAWAYGESIMDLRTLMTGKKVPVIKTRENWQLSMASLLKLGTKEDTGAEGAKEEEGIGYEEYLKILLFMEKQECLQSRVLDLIEWNMQMRLNCPFFQADSCVTRIKIFSRCKMRTGITYQFSTFYQYR